VNTDGLGRIIYYYDTPKFEMRVNGVVELTINSSGCLSEAFVVSSDSSLKENVNIVDGLDCIDVVKSVSPKTYTRNDLHDTSKRWIGFIAQEVEAALDNNITGGTNLVMINQNADGVPLKGIDYGRLTTILWGVCKNLIDRVEALEAAAV